MSDRNPAPQRPPFLLASGALLIGVLVVAIIFINKASAPNPTAVTTTSPTASVSASASPSSSSSASPSAAPIPYADCTTSTFGSPLQPLNPPSSVHAYSAAPAMTIDTSKLYEATITTPRGTMVICLQPALAPNTVNNFVTLARNHFYDGLTFHRVVASFVVQGGDPQGNGNGGPGYKFNDEPVRQSYVQGAVAMANSGANTNGSQFFICIADDTSKLQPLYNLFGKLVTGIDVAIVTVQGDVMSSVTVTQSQ